MRNLKRTIVILALQFFLIPIVSNSQSVPLSQQNGFNFKELVTYSLPHNNSHIKHSQNEKNGLPMWAGFSLFTEITPKTEGQIIRWPNGALSWMVRATSPNAPALSIVLEVSHLPNEGIFYIYSEQNPERVYTISAKDLKSNYISTPPIAGDALIIEYSELNGNNGVEIQGSFVITDLVVLYNGLESLIGSKDLGDSDYCQININCSPEGDEWQDEKRGVARLLLREGSSWGWCSGTLINNTTQDGKPYFLTAEHCGGNASTADRNVWQFFFNYERPGCEDEGTPPNNVIVGCSFVAKGPISGGSDFQLVELSSEPPLEWNPYYNGWDRGTTGSTGGVGIHHPSGDVKKISTYTGTLSSSSPNIGGSQMATNSAWRVTWSATENEHGVTEGGSSGSPIFSSTGLVVGTLSGGSSFCDTPTYPDYYGKFDYHWESNGTTDETMLKPWLDPEDTGLTSLPGYDPNMGLNSNFSASKTVVELEEEVIFTDLSTGPDISSWNWNFGEGAVPETATGQGPHTVYYNTLGNKTVSLTINDESTTTKDDYIFVKEPSETFVVFEQLPDIDQGGAVTSTNSGTINYEVADNFTEVYGLIEAVVVQGIYAYHDGSGWQECEPEANMQFDIKFYEPHDEQPDWVNPQIEFTSYSNATVFAGWNDWTVYEFELEFPGYAEGYGDGWMSVQAQNTNCWFLWFRSNDGDGYSYQYNHGAKNNREELRAIKTNNNSKDAIDYDVAFQLWARPVDESATIFSFDFEEDVILEVEISYVIQNQATIDILVELGTDLTALTPIITFSEGATLDPPGGVETDFTNPVKYSVTSEDEEITNYYTVTVTEREPNTDAFILDFDFEEDVILEIDFSEIEDNQASIDVLVEFGTDLTALTPIITFSEGATLDPPSGVETDFTNPVTYSVTAEDQETTNNFTITVTEREPNTDAFILDFDFEEDVILEIDFSDIEDNQATIDILVEHDTDITGLTPIIDISHAATINPPDGVATDFTNPVTYTVTAEDGETTTIYTVDVTKRQLNDEAFILAFDFVEDVVLNVEISDVEENEAVISVTVEYSTNLTSLTPNISISEGASISPTGGTSMDFSNPVVFTVTSENQNTVNEYTVVVLNELATVVFNVVDKQQQPVEDADIEIEGIEGDITTDQSGVASIRLNDGTYNFGVSAQDYHDYSSTFTVSQLLVEVDVQLILVGIEKPSYSAIKIFPNPFSDAISIQNTQDISQIVISNILGKPLVSIMNAKSNEIITVDTNELPPGLYLISIYYRDGNRVVKKVVKK